MNMSDRRQSIVVINTRRLTANINSPTAIDLHGYKDLMKISNTEKNILLKGIIQSFKRKFN